MGAGMDRPQSPWPRGEALCDPDGEREAGLAWQPGMHRTAPDASSSAARARLQPGNLGATHSSVEVDHIQLRQLMVPSHGKMPPAFRCLNQSRFAVHRCSFESFPNPADQWTAAVPRPHSHLRI
jgi:hypothetical protein